MAELKTKVNDASVGKFIEGIKDEQTRTDCYQMMDMMKKATHTAHKNWKTKSK